MPNQKITKPRGTADVLPVEAARWRALEQTVTNIALNHGFGELRMPTFEHTELFSRGVGDTTDIVTKEMYTFDSKGGKSLTLRPEGTASAVRACIENGLLAGAMPLKLFYIAPMFRYEKPQSGRLREHHQFGVECFGAEGPDGDLEVISIGNAYMSSVFPSPANASVELHINSIGCTDCRAAYRAGLLEYLSGKPMCKLCAERAERNPLRVLDCKDDNCRGIVKNAPSMQNILCDPCAAHYNEVLSGLDRLGIHYIQDDRLVRGLDYYNGIVFEFIYNGLTIIGGGRYDSLVEQLGGNPMPACGFGSGLERILAVQSEMDTSLNEPAKNLVYIAVADTPESPAAVTARALISALRLTGRAERDITGRSLKAQLKHADKLGARFLIVIGDDEVRTGQVIIKDMTNGEKSDCKLDSREVIKYVY
jgi:histidyl-tRNA synthetase